MKKVFQIIADVWIISVLSLAIFLVFYENISGKIVVKSLFPTIFCNNWYITCYLLIFMLHPYLNMMIKKMTQRQLISFNFVSVVLYLGFAFISRSLFFYNHLIMFMILYFIIAYMKIYQHSFSSSNRVNIVFLIIGIGGTIGLVLITNILGQYVTYLEDKVQYWVTNNNPFIILTAVSLFNLFRKKNWVNLKINKFAGLSLFIYIIHENILVRTYFRPLIYAYIYDTFGYQYLVLWVLGFAVVLFVASLALRSKGKILETRE